MSSLHVILDTQNRNWQKPPIKDVHVAVLDIGDLDYDAAALESVAKRLAHLLLQTVYGAEGLIDG